MFTSHQAHSVHRIVLFAVITFAVTSIGCTRPSEEAQLSNAEREAELSFTAVGRDGAFAAGLKPEDVVIEVGGQRIAVERLITVNGGQLSDSAVQSPQAPQGGATTAAGANASGQIVAIVIDDTAIGPDDATAVAGALDALNKELVAGRGPIGVATTGPSGIMVDLTYETSGLRQVIDAARAGKLTFRSPPDAAMANAARDSTIVSFVSGVGKIKARRKVVVVVGKSAAVSSDRQASLKQVAGNADAGLVKIVWLDLHETGCDQQPGIVTDSQLLSGAGACAEVNDAAGLARVFAQARLFLSSYYVAQYRASGSPVGEPQIRIVRDGVVAR